MSSVIIKTPQQIELMRQSGRLLARVFKMLDQNIVVGMTTLEIDQLATDFIRQQLNARPASIGQYDYQFASNISVNEVICHGVPGNYRIKNRDIFNVDITLEKNGFIADSSKMYVMPDASVEARKLVKVTYEALFKGIATVKPGNTLGDIGAAIQKHAHTNGYSVVREYCGHGIGQQMHEDPQVLHYGKAGTGLVLQPGMTFTIEPMINQGNARIKTLKDNWTVVTKDRKLSAQWEHTLAVTQDGVEILTLREEETNHMASA